MKAKRFHLNADDYQDNAKSLMQSTYHHSPDKKWIKHKLRSIDKKY
jgi:hypothetical protein